MNVFEPFSCSSGPKNARLVVVLEAWGEREAALKRPLVGASGQEFLRMLIEAGWADPRTAQNIIDALWPDSRVAPETMLALREYWLDKASMLWTNVFNLRPGPQSNDIELLCGPKAAVGENYALPPLKQGKYILPQFLPHVDRLRRELLETRPNLVLVCGNVATWAILQATNIGFIRGAITSSPLVEGLKVLPTYHPAALFRKWDWRPIVLADLMKTKHEQGFPEIRRPARKVLINPTIAELEIFEKSLDESTILSVDIETAAKQITCLGFATSKAEAVVIPFWGAGPEAPHYWSTASEEAAAWRLVRRLLSRPNPKLFQNGVYDLQYLSRMGFTVRNCQHDTMLLHHSLFPELPKGLGFLGSIYSNEAAWKLMRHDDSNKRDE